jgi:hypothetical protein
MPRFVVLRHDFPPGHARGLHWDLLLESAGVLRAWALAAEPLSQPEIQAEQLADHRAMYLEYEGPVSGDRGSVTRWDAGDYRLEYDAPGRLVCAVEGRRLRGRLSLEEGADHFWRVVFSAEPTTG